MTSPSYHSFWNPSYEARGVGLTDVLIVLNGENQNEVANITAREAALGFKATYISTYTNFLNEDLAKYAHIWDLGYNTRIPPLVQSKYIDYLQNGGAVFMMGENANFVARNNDIFSLIGVAGGGPVTNGTGSSYNATVNIVPEFLLANQTPTVTFPAPGGFGLIGSGTAITTGLICAVMWKTGSLSGCPRGALVSVLDVNFLQNGYLQSDFVDNLVVILNKK